MFTWLITGHTEQHHVVGHLPTYITVRHPRRILQLAIIMIWIKEIHITQYYTGTVFVMISDTKPQAKMMQASALQLQLSAAAVL